MKRIVFLLIFLGFIDSAICQEPEQTTFINQPLVTEFENEPVVKYKITRLDCATYFSDDLDNPQYIFDESFDAVVTYYYQENRERLLICTDVTWNRLIYTYEKFPGPPLENEYEVASQDSITRWE